MNARKPRVSIVVIFHDMQREGARTLHSLSCSYQQGVTPPDYEVLAIDSGSDHALDPAFVSANGENFFYHYHRTDSVSPVGAVNLGARMARGDYLVIIVDGARMTSAGLVANTIKAAGLFPDPAVFSLSWHLGPDVQNKSMLDGYNQEVEDRLLDSIAWPSDGYRLFEISTLAQSSGKGFLGGVPSEFSWICTRRSTFLEMGGFDEGFQSPGGGQVNHDFRNRLMTRAGISPVMLLGEGVFHQFHGGVATNVPMDRHPAENFREEYKRLRGDYYTPAPTPPVFFFGTLPKAARRFLGA